MAITSKVSLLIVNYNTGRLVEEIIKDLAGDPNLEFVVVDNASTSSLVTFPSSVKFIQNTTNLGFGHAVNQAAQVATGEYLYLLNPDAQLTKKALAQMIETSKSFHDQAIIAPRLLNEDGTVQESCFNEQSIINAIKEFWFGQKGAYSKYLPVGDKPTKVDIAVAAAWLIPKQVWAKVGGFDEKYFLYFEDLDLCDRARSLGISIIYDPQSTIFHLHGVSSRTNNKTSELFIKSANLYHGATKKLIIDLVIKIGNKL